MDESLVSYLDDRSFLGTWRRCTRNDGKRHPVRRICANGKRCCAYEHVECSHGGGRWVAGYLVSHSWLLGPVGHRKTNGRGRGRSPPCKMPHIEYAQQPMQQTNALYSMGIIVCVVCLLRRFYPLALASGAWRNPFKRLLRNTGRGQQQPPLSISLSLLSDMVYLSLSLV